MRSGRPHPSASASGPGRPAARLLLLVLALVLGGYGYGPEQDPLVEQSKLVAADAYAGRWDAARRRLRELEPSLNEIAETLDVDLAPEILRSLAQRDGAALARQLTTLAILAVQVKFESSRREELKEYYAAKYRVEAARSYYTELIAPAVRRHDRTAGSRLHEEIWSGFDAARAALGSPGFLGRGRVPPDAEAFDAADARITTAFRELFPFLPEVRR